jgi:hypothetical protein
MTPLDVCCQPEGMEAGADAQDFRSSTPTRPGVTCELDEALYEPPCLVEPPRWEAITTAVRCALANDVCQAAEFVRPGYGWWSTQPRIQKEEEVNDSKAKNGAEQAEPVGEHHHRDHSDRAVRATASRPTDSSTSVRLPYRPVGSPPWQEP